MNSCFIEWRNGRVLYARTVTLMMEYSVLPGVNHTPPVTANPTPSSFLLFVTSAQSFNASSPNNVTSPNMTSGFNPDESPAYVVMRRLQTVLIPVICLLGIVGNVVAAATFLSPSLNKTSCCLHLASKSLNDIGFLVSLFVVWLYRLRVPLFTTPGVCQLTVFLTYVCGCLSVWFVVFITAENFLRLTQPRLVQKYCTVPMAKRIVAGSVLASCLFYNFSIWTTGVTDGPAGTRQCTSLSHFQDVVMALTVIDTTLTLIVPSILIFFLLVAIVFKSMESFERKKRLRSSSLQAAGPKQKKRHTPEGKMTTFLFALSIIFLSLNLPTHTIRLKLLIQMYIQRVFPSYADIILQRVFEILLYFNFSTNCLIHLLFGERFRQVFKELFLARCCPKKAPGGSQGDGEEGSMVMASRTRRGEAEEPLSQATVVNDTSCADNV
ncbi:uncharacterized protein LOC143275215 [Babylonia areolata]|uniref:uncharacterized protein LOC143275215 n=1 Tax=Babylonia areolata TaxID=304850 RepID=UPI003FD2D94A